MSYAFTFDASACSGCKACQVACKDKHSLPVGVLWRRVYEVSGGSWQPQGESWATDVFAYNLSIACNHCVHPKCAGVCPVDAYIVRRDGIVYIDESKCMGCGYCARACPYAAPQYHPELRHMTKCNFCHDHIDAGLPPACVAACPMRVLDFVVVNDWLPVISEKHQPLWDLPATSHPYPLPDFSRTQPHMALKLHAGMENELEKRVTNREEVQPRRQVRLTARQEAWFGALGILGVVSGESPLILFTLLGQLAAGMAVVLALTGLPDWKLGPFFQIGAYLMGAGLFALGHLKTKKNAWRALGHLEKSWLSREILMAGVFGLAWLVTLVQMAQQGAGPVKLWPEARFEVALWLPALAGAAFVYSMAQVYRIKAVPAWNSWRTEAAFFLSAGSLGMMAAFRPEGLAGVWLPLGLLLAAKAALALSDGSRSFMTARRLRVAVIGLAAAGAVALAGAPGAAAGWLSAAISILIIYEEWIGRWLFYTAPDERVM